VEQFTFRKELNSLKKIELEKKMILKENEGKDDERGRRLFVAP